MQLVNYQNFINGQFVASDEARIKVINPANQAVLATIPQSSINTVQEAINSAKAAQQAWAKKASSQRALYLKNIAAAIRNQQPELSHSLTQEQGKTLEQSEGEVKATADYFEYMAEWARRLEGEVLPSDRTNETIFLNRKPIGVVGGIIPWNFPWFILARKVATALITGNTIVIKPSEETPINAFLFADIVKQVELPAGVFNLVSGRGDVGAALCENPDIGMISFTGSVETGKHIMASCAQNLTKVNLELGGKAPVIVSANADLDLAVDAIHSSRILNTGQACICPERVYVDKSVAEYFIEALKQRMQNTTFGDALQESVDMGPLVNKQGLNKVSDIVEQAKKEGASVLCGGSVAEGTSGFHYLPTVLLVKNNDATIMQKEIFGPVIPVMIVDDLQQAIDLANDSEYGLSSSIFSNDANEIMKAIRELSFGETFVNRDHLEAMQGFHAGSRKSGIGGADGKHGLLEYTQTQVVYWQSQL